MAAYEFWANNLLSPKLNYSQRIYKKKLCWTLEPCLISENFFMLLLFEERLGGVQPLLEIGFHITKWRY